MSFVIGLFIGALLGVLTMALVSANEESGDDDESKN